MKRRLEIARRVLECLYSIVFFSACMLFWLHVFAKLEVSAAHVCCLAVLCVLSYAAREFMPNYLTIAISHIVMATVAAALPFSLSARIFMAALCLVVLLPGASAYAKRGGRLRCDDNVSWPSILACLVFSLFGLADESRTFSNIMYAVVLCLLTMILLRIYLSGASAYMECTVHVDGLPIGEIIRTNTRIVAVIILCTLALMLTCGLPDMKDALAAAAKSIIRFVKIAAALLIFLLEVLLSKLPVGSGSEQTYDETYSYEQIPETGSTFATVVTGILIAVILILAMCFAVRFVGQLICSLLQRRIYTTDIVENSRPGEMRAERVRAPVRRIFPLNRTERFRRMYKNEIEKYRYDVTLNEFQTCGDIEEDIKARELGDIHELNELYKSVRYGGRKVDRDVIRELNYLIRKNN